jgi:hypothetical protein
MTATTPPPATAFATPAGRARGDRRPGYLVLGLGLTIVAVTGAVVAGTGFWFVMLWAVLPDVALLLAIGSRGSPGQLPRRAVPAYNLLHAPALPLVLLAFAAVGLLGSAWLVAGITWLAHISFDRGFGYGPRTPEGWQRG